MKREQKKERKKFSAEGNGGGVKEVSARKRRIRRRSEGRGIMLFS
jgi:hypothetical protein